MSTPDAPLDVQVARADAILRMYEGALRSVAARAAYAREQYTSVGVSDEQWRAMTFEEREAVLRRARKPRKSR